MFQLKVRWSEWLSCKMQRGETETHQRTAKVRPAAVLQVLCPTHAAPSHVSGASRRQLVAPHSAGRGGTPDRNSPCRTPRSPAREEIKVSVTRLPQPSPCGCPLSPHAHTHTHTRTHGRLASCQWPMMLCRTSSSLRGGHFTAWLKMLATSPSTEESVSEVYESEAE